MKLQAINESNDPLQSVGEFDVVLPLDPMIQSRDEALKHLTAQFTTEPAPGVTPIKGIVTSFEPPDENGLVNAKVRTTVESYIRNSIEFDIGPYEILKVIKDATTPEITAAAMEFMKTGDFKVVKLGAPGTDADTTAKLKW